MKTNFSSDESNDGSIVNELHNSKQFGEAQVDEIKTIEAGGACRSYRVEQWVVKAFDELRKHCGYAIQKSIVDLLEEVDVKPLINMLMYFFLDVKKQDSSL